MADQVAVDVAITWAGAAGCAYYLYFLYAHGRPGVAALRFLTLLLTALLLVRGFAWLAPQAALGRVTFAIATWLPLAVTLFVERVLRRHHPLWFKLLALATTVVFFLCDVVANLPEQRLWLQAFLACFVIVMSINAILLLARSNAALSFGEARLADLLLLIAALSVPLVISDFRTLVGVTPVRLGAIAALLFVCGMLGSAARSMSVAAWALRFLLLLALAIGFAGLAGLASQGLDFDSWWQATLRIWPVAYAWMLLTGIVVNARAIASAGSDGVFLRWLARAPLDSVEQFLSVLGSSPDAESNIILRANDLADYRTEALTRWVDAKGGVASLAAARAPRGDSELADSAEQWVDLLERTQMTHGFLARESPPTVVLVNLPGTTSAAAAELRLSVVQHIARQLRGDRS